MITYNPKDWFKLIFQFHKSDTFRILLPNMLVLAAFTTVIVFIEDRYLNIQIKNTTIFHQILGFVLSMLLVFRINSAYDRWWEGRKLWGSLVNNTRNLALKINAYLPYSRKNERKELFVLLSNYSFSLKEHLKDKIKEEEMDESAYFQIKNWKSSFHKPNYIAGQIYLLIENWKNERLIQPEQVLILNEELKSLTEITGACERIKNTPIPYAYSLYLKKIIFIYIITMPLTFGVDFGYWAIPLVMFIFYAFASLELISEEIEDPFGDDANDLPTDDLAQKIRINSKEILLDRID